jgi:hypothetical protein
MTEPFQVPDTAKIRADLADDLDYGYVVEYAEKLCDAVDILHLQRDVLAGALRATAIGMWEDGDRQMAVDIEDFVAVTLAHPIEGIIAPETPEDRQEMLDGGEIPEDIPAAGREWIDVIRPQVREKAAAQYAGDSE